MLSLARKLRKFDRPTETCIRIYKVLPRGFKNSLVLPRNFEVPFILPYAWLATRVQHQLDPVLWAASLSGRQ